MLELQLDIRTLSFVTVFFSALYGVGLLVVAFRHDDQRGISLFGQSILVLSAGFLLMGLRGRIPDLLSIVLANSLIVAAFVLFDRAFSTFLKSKTSGTRIGLPLVALLPFLLAYYTYHTPSVSIRIAIVSLFIGILTGLCAWRIMHGTRNDIPEAKWFLGLPFIISSVFILFRSMWAIDETSLKDFMSASTIHQLAFLMINLLVLTSSFGLLWLLSARLQRELREQARIDTLTHTHNRRALHEIAPRELARSKRHALPLSVIMSDIDHFKIINDTYGHGTGDLVLTNFAETVQNLLRKQDYLIRYGGEEFLVLLPDTEVTQAELVAEKLRTVIETAPLAEEPQVSATASFGVTTLNGNEPWETLISRADAALYEAKSKGRNLVIRF